MKNSLVIVESPAKAKTISKFLGKKYKVIASMGHVRDLPKSELGINTENGYEPKYITIRGKGNTLNTIKKEAKKAEKVFLATDIDREGEAISWHLSYYLNINEKDKCRIVFNEITKDAVKNAAKNPRKINLDLVNAQQARRILDRLVGYKLSPLLWEKVKKGLSAGRVQSVAVRLICDRENEITSFIPKEYWSITGFFKGDKNKKSTFEGKLVKHKGKKFDINNKKEADKILSYLENKKYKVLNIDKKERKKNPALPFTTSNLQQEASRKLGYSPKKTMMLAQQLYEGLNIKGEGSVGLITYLRTDSTRVSENAALEAHKLIEKTYGKDYIKQKTKSVNTGNKKNKIQDAHEAIRPTNVTKNPEDIKDSLNKDQYKIYNLIWKRFVASQMKEAKFEVISIDIECGEYLFRSTGSKLLFPGYMKVYTESSDEEIDNEKDTVLPDLKIGQNLFIDKIEPKQHFTQPPARFSEAMLIKTLEEKGIGRPSTYAPIIDTIQQRGYVEKIEKKFKPTELGFIVVDVLKNYFKKIIDIDFTAGMESQFDKVEEGTIEWKNIIDVFYKEFEKDLTNAKEEMEEIKIDDQKSEEKCEKCGEFLVIKHGRYGKFLACPNFPECKNTKPFMEKIGINCPKCKGDIVKKKSKKNRLFYGCSNFPECDFMSWDKPIKEKCPECKATLVERVNKKSKKHKCLKCNYEKTM